MNEKISETALAIASLRALANYETDATLQSHDDLAELFLPEDRQLALQTLNSRDAIKQHIPKGMYEYVIARTKYFDQIFVEALTKNVEQIVFLGAGFDSRAYRFHQLITGTKLFELDAQPTQAHKLLRLRQHSIAIHPNISFISLNFETDDPIAALCRAGYNQCQRTLFLWEGVTFYLAKDTVTRMLLNLKAHSGSGSRICFDFQTIQDDQDLIKTGLADEEIQFGIKSDRIDDFIREHQYHVVEHLSAVEMERRFLTLQTDEVVGRIMPMMNFLLIEHQ